MYRKPREDGLPREDNDRFEGYCVDLADKIFRHILKVPYKLKIVADGMYGAKTTPEGTWNGMIGELTRQVLCFSAHSPPHSNGYRIGSPTVCIFCTFVIVL